MIEPELALSTLAYSGVGGFGLGFSFLVVRWLATFIAGRVDKKEEHIDTVTRELIEALQQQVNRLSQAERDLRAEFTSYRRDTDERLQDCQRKHAESEAEVMRLKAIMQGRGDFNNEMQAATVAAKKAAGQ